MTPWRPSWRCGATDARRGAGLRCSGTASNRWLEVCIAFFDELVEMRRQSFNVELQVNALAEKMTRTGRDKEGRSTRGEEMGREGEVDKE